MNKLNKTLVAAAVTGLMAVPSVNAEYYIQEAFYTKNASGTIKFTGSGCKTLKYKKLNASLWISDGFEGYFEGGFEGSFEGGPQTAQYVVNFTESTFGSAFDGAGPLVASNKGRTYNMDTSYSDYFNLENVFGYYIDAELDGQSSGDGCKDPGGFNYDLMINRYEAKISNNGKQAKLKLDAEGTYLDTKKDKDRKVKLKINAKMDVQNPS